MRTQQADITPYSIILVDEPPGRLGYRVGRMADAGHMWDLANGLHKPIESDEVTVLAPGRWIGGQPVEPDGEKQGSFLAVERHLRDKLTARMGQAVYAEALYKALGVGVDCETPAEALALILQWATNHQLRFQHYRPRLPVLPVLVEWFEQLWIEQLWIDAKNPNYQTHRPGREAELPPEWRLGLYYLVFGEPLLAPRV